jgi:hypothetical protein
VEININGNEIAVSKQSSWPIPSRRIEKLLPRPGNQSDLNSRRAALLKTVNPSNETASVIIVENKAHDFAEFSFLRKNAAMPLNNGITISNNEIIYPIRLRRSFNKFYNFKYSIHL